MKIIEQKKNSFSLVVWNVIFKQKFFKTKKKKYQNPIFAFKNERIENLLSLKLFNTLIRDIFAYLQQTANKEYFLCLSAKYWTSFF